jgi:glutathione S-transferase
VGEAKPVLWHIPVSHYSEKARWALGHKSVDHERRAPLAGAHILEALWLTRGSSKTLPILRLEGRTIGDSTEIIAALEARYPEPALYPDDPDERRRALELEEFFDEELGPYIRRYAWHELRTDRARMSELAVRMLPGPMQGFPPARATAGRYGSALVQLRYRAGSVEGAAEARAKVLAALDRLERELDDAGGEYLVGDAFSVADLTAAALFYPLVNPPEGPSLLPDPLPARLEEFRAPLRQRPGYQWVAETYRRHRQPAASVLVSR